MMSSRDRVPEALRRFLTADQVASDAEVLDLAQAAARLQEAPEMVDRWIREKQLLAWQTPSGLRIPAEQILGPHRVLPGLARVLETIPDARSAWDFLALESPFFPGEPQRPLDVLKAGQLDDVIRASIAHGEAFS
jgi:hypothetical protein